jgi:hypothetical protein
MGSPDPDADRALQQALSLIAGQMRRRLARDPGGHLLLGGGEEIEITIRLAVDPQRPVEPSQLAAAARELDSDLEHGLATLIRQRAAWRPGHVTCLRCAPAPCDHGRPAGPREVFAGYGPSGLPRFRDLGQLLLELRDPRVDRLYAVATTPAASIRTGSRPGARRREPHPASAPPGESAFLAHVMTYPALAADLLPAYVRPDLPRLVGQVVAGWYLFPGSKGHLETVALTIQILATPSARGRHRLGFNLVGSGPGGESLSALPGVSPPGARQRTVGEEREQGDTVPPWTGAMLWAQGILRQLERTALAAEQLDRRLHGLLRGIAARLEHDRRASGRRTRHAEERHQSGERPTRQALADAARASSEQVLVDVQRSTLVVLGERGRAHVFTPGGRLVTSLRYGAEAIARRRERGTWRLAKAEELAALQGALAGGMGTDLEATATATGALPGPVTATS